MRKFKMLSQAQQGAVEHEVRYMLHASRDTLRNRDQDTTDITFDVTEGHYGEAFGVMRGLYALGYGEFGSDNVPNSVHPQWNLKWWFRQIEDHVLSEENFGDHGLCNNECDHCLYTYGKDAVRRRVTRDGKDVIVSIETSSR